MGLFSKKKNRQEDYEEYSNSISQQTQEYERYQPQYGQYQPQYAQPQPPQCEQYQYPPSQPQYQEPQQPEYAAPQQQFVDLQQEKQNSYIKKNIITYDELLPEIQSYMSENYADALLNMDKETEFKNNLRQYIINKNYYVDGKSIGQLISMLYSDMAQFSILTDYLNRVDIEEVNVNSWDDIEIKPSGGDSYKAKETFKSAQNCIDIIKRLLHDQGKMAFDDSRPIAKGFLRNNVRITALYNSIMDKERGAACSIRIVNPKQLSKIDFLKSGTCTEDMYNFLSICFNHGVSEIFAGETGSGKTTIMSDIMKNYPDQKRLITIESETREFNLVKKDRNGKIINNVLHLITRDSDDKSRAVTQLDLLTAAMTMDPDALCMAEIKFGGEAWGAQEAARTGHAVMATTHASSIEGIYTRLGTLCIQEYSNIPYNTILQLVSDAFPIAVYQHKFEDGVRRITEISECIQDGEHISFNTLWRYHKERDVIFSDGRIKVEGKFVRVNPFSEGLKNRLFNNGLSLDEMENLNIYSSIHYREEYEEESAETEVYQPQTIDEYKDSSDPIKPESKPKTKVPKSAKTGKRSESKELILKFIQACRNSDISIENESTDKIYNWFENCCLESGIEPMRKCEFSKQIKSILNLEIVERSIEGKKYRIFVRADGKESQK